MGDCGGDLGGEEVSDRDRERLCDTGGEEVSDRDRERLCDTGGEE